MSNTQPVYSTNKVAAIFQHVGHDFHVVVDTLAHDVVEVVEFPAKVNAVKNSAVGSFEILKCDIAAIEAAFTSEIAPATIASASFGANVTADIAAISDLPSLWKAVANLVRDVESAYASINAAAAGQSVDATNTTVGGIKND